MSFKKLNLSSELVQVVEKAGYKEPTEIQKKAIPSILMGRDVLGCAQTGTGKTAAFLLPIIDILTHDRARAAMPRCVVLTPTRELAIQISDEFNKFNSSTNLKYAVLVGGSSPVIQERALAQCPDILIATPGRLMDMCERGKIMLLDVKILVLDEADRMLDMGFIPDIEKLITLLPKKRQSLLLSATMPKEIKKLAGNMLDNPNEISIAPQNKVSKTIIQTAIQTTKRGKKKTLRDLLSKEDVKQTIVFCNQKKDVADLTRSLKQYDFNAIAIHGDMTQMKRNEALDAFRKGTAKILVASDVAARGLDVEGLSHVFNFDVPINDEDYIHRIGRTGRAGQSGISVSILTLEDEKNWNKVINSAKAKIIEYGTEKPFVLLKEEKIKPEVVKPKKIEPVKKTNPKQEKQPHPQSQIKTAIIHPNQKGFGDNVPAFFNVEVNIKK